ncbi:MAG: hypothetical protein M3Z24_17365 [Chloroflexota bacterium]|nr:hypothetical protein [Chloroflexota bacterium]
MASSNAGNSCTNCGQPFAAGAAFCGSCGNPIKNTSNDQTAMQYRPSPADGNDMMAHPTPPLPVSGANYNSSAQAPSPYSTVQQTPPPPPMGSGFLQPPLTDNMQSMQQPMGNSGFQQPPGSVDNADNYQKLAVPPRKSFWTPKRVFITFALVLLAILIAGGSLFAYAYQRGLSASNHPAQTTGPAPVGTTSSGQTPVATTDTGQTPVATNTGQTPTATTNTGATPTPTIIAVAPGTTLYQINFPSNNSTDASQWSGGTWKIVDGIPTNDGSGYSFLVAPYQPTTRDYAVIATVGTPSNRCSDLGVVARGASDGSGDVADYNNTSQMRVQTPGVSSDWYSFAAGTTRFTIRLEVKGITSKVFINGSKSPAVTVDDTSRTDPGLAGISANYCQAQIFSFEVIAL